MGTDYAKALLVAVTMSKVHFDKEMAERRERLAIRYQWHRLAQIYQETRRRYERRFSKPMVRTPKLITKNITDWRNGFGDGAKHGWQLDRVEGYPVSNLYNAALALRNSPGLSGLIELDEAGKAIMLKGPLPWAHWESFNFEMRRLKDEDLTGLQEYLQAMGLQSLTREDCLGAVRLIARENQRGGQP